MTIAAEILQLLNENLKTNLRHAIYPGHGILIYCEVIGWKMALHEISGALVGVTILKLDGSHAHLVFRRDKLTQKLTHSRRA